VSWRLAPDAVQDLDELLAYIAVDDLNAALTMHSRIVQTIEQIAAGELPGRVTHVSGVTRPVKSWPVPPYRI
jgi:plasmid stabilization system protein ParE